MEPTMAVQKARPTAYQKAPPKAPRWGERWDWMREHRKEVKSAHHSAPCSAVHWVGPKEPRSAGTKVGHLAKTKDDRSVLH
jgi:hypothetical protein